MQTIQARSASRLLAWSICKTDWLHSLADCQQRLAPRSLHACSSTSSLSQAPCWTTVSTKMPSQFWHSADQTLKEVLMQPASVWAVALIAFGAAAKRFCTSVPLAHWFSHPWMLTMLPFWQSGCNQASCHSCYFTQTDLEKGVPQRLTLPTTLTCSSYSTSAASIPATYLAGHKWQDIVSWPAPLVQ